MWALRKSGVTFRKRAYDGFRSGARGRGSEVAAAEIAELAPPTVVACVRSRAARALSARPLAIRVLQNLNPPSDRCDCAQHRCANGQAICVRIPPSACVRDGQSSARAAMSTITILNVAD